jgi:hypothetical protein
VLGMQCRAAAHHHWVALSPGGSVTRRLCHPEALAQAPESFLLPRTCDGTSFRGTMSLSCGWCQPESLVVDFYCQPLAAAVTVVLCG